MIRLLRTFVWLRWRLLTNGLRGGHRRDAVERLSRVFALLAPVAGAIIFGLASIVLAGLGIGAGILLAGAGTESRPESGILTGVRLLLLVVTAVLIFLPLGRSMQAGMPGVQRLLLLPIPRAALHLADVAAGLFDPWLCFIAPGLVLMSLAMAVSGRMLAGAAALAGGALLLGVLACLSALASFLIQWVMRDRRRAEASALLLMLALTIGGMLPALFVMEDLPDTPGRSTQFKTKWAIPAPSWTVPLPSEMYAWTVRAGLNGRPGAVLAGIGLLLGEGALLFWVSSKVHARLLTSTAASGTRRGGFGKPGRETPLPGLGPGAAGVARAQVTTALRSLRGRMGVFFNAPALFLMGLLFHSVSGIDQTLGIFSLDGPTLFGIGALLTMLSLQPILMNQFASDRAGLTMQLLAPVTDRDLLLGKAAGGTWLAAISCALCLVASLFAVPGGSLWSWLSSILGAASIVILAIPVAAVLSILFPRRADLSRMGGGGNAHGMAVLLGSLVTMAAAIPASLVLVAGTWLEMPGISALVSAVWLALCVPLSLLCLLALAPVLRARRENLMLVAGGG
ncbi:MAG: hypothetical protein ACREAA_00525 [Candidatus Polarisedimenticolia bacterium]